MTREEAIKCIKAAQPFGAAFTEALETLIPEIKESEDERLRKRLLSRLDYWAENGSDADREEISAEKAWFEKQGEQKPAWSEEDEKIYSRIYDLIHEAAYLNYDVDEDGKKLGEYAKMTNWLKSLKPQPHWKPSDEQMSALRHCCDGWTDNADGRLESLYSDLQKL